MCNQSKDDRVSVATSSRASRGAHSPRTACPIMGFSSHNGYSNRPHTISRTNSSTSGGSRDPSAARPRPNSLGIPGASSLEIWFERVARLGCDRRSVRDLRAANHPAASSRSSPRSSRRSQFPTLEPRHPSGVDCVGRGWPDRRSKVFGTRRAARRVCDERSREPASKMIGVARKTLSEFATTMSTIWIPQPSPRNRLDAAHQAVTWRIQ